MVQAATSVTPAPIRRWWSISGDSSLVISLPASSGCLLGGFVVVWMVRTPRAAVGADQVQVALHVVDSAPVTESRAGHAAANAANLRAAPGRAWQWRVK